MATTVADQLITALVDAGVRRIYGIVGDSLNPVVDAVRRTGGSAAGGIDWIHVRHEEAAAFAASAEAQLTGRPAVCAGSCGPGNLHLINGLYDAHRSGAAVLAIASHIPSTEIGQGYFQETHPDRLFLECSDYTELVSNPAQAPGVFHGALQTVLGAGGVSVVTLPGDVAMQDAVGEVRPPAVPTGSTLVPDDATIDRLVAEIDAADTVAIFAGYGAREAHDEIMALAEKIGAPVGHSLRGKDFIEHDNPFDVGMTGLLGYGAAYAGMHDADLLLMLGTDFPYSQFLPAKTRTVQIDVNPAHLGRRTTVELPVLGDVRATVAAVLGRVATKPDRSFLDRWLDKHHRMLEKVVGAYTENAEKFVPIHPEYAAAVLDEVAAVDAVFTTDTGMCNVWTARYLRATGERRFLSSGNHGSMANALPHAIGAQLAYPGRQVVSVSGDGGLAMLLGELLTVTMYELPVKIVVFDNSTLGMVKAEMLVDGLPDFGVDVPQADYTGIARAAGMHAVRVDRPEQLRDALTEALAVDGPALVQVITDPRALSMPPTVSGEQLRGFALAMSKTVLTGGIGEAVALARSNLRNIPRP